MDRFKINKHRGSYDLATEHALRCIYEGIILKIDGQEFEYDKKNNELYIRDYCTTSVYKPSFNGNFCNPFDKLIRKEIITNDNREQCI